MLISLWKIFLKERKGTPEYRRKENTYTTKRKDKSLFKEKETDYSQKNITFARNKNIIHIV